MTHVLRSALLLCSLLLSASGAMAATLQVDRSGQLIGASGVAVDGALYNVEFLDGTCAEVFGDCTEGATGLPFNDMATALLAGQALVNQVLLDGPLGLFDTRPSLVRGCDSDAPCFTFIPYGFGTGTAMDSVLVANHSVNLAVDYAFDSSHDLSLQGNLNYARFTAAASAPGLAPVPVPAPLLLLLGGVGGLAFLRGARRG